MNETKFTAKQISDFRRYEKVRKNGKWNMFLPQARAASGLSMSSYSFCMDNYDGLREQSEARP